MKHVINRVGSIAFAAGLLAMFICACAPQSSTDPVPVQPDVKVSPWPTHLPSQTPSPNGAASSGEAPQAAVIIYVGDQIYRIVPLEDDVITVEQADGMINEVTISEHGVYMSHSTCDNQDCVQQGEITLSNYQERILMNWVICLPNQVSLELYVKEDG